MTIDRLGPAPARIIGLMSGTSLDGIDAALVRFAGPPDDPQWAIERFISLPYSLERRAEIQYAIEHGRAPELCRLNADLGEWLAEAALAVCREAGLTSGDVTAIGSHGQTIWHDPPSDGRRGATLQLGCAATIAERTGIDVISDFRARDVAAGGQGAPLVPWIDRLLFAVPDRVRVLVNIGGMANLTRVPRRGAQEPVLAFDTGPGNALIDATAEIATGGAERFDNEGALASRGTVDPSLLDLLLQHPFFKRAPPKSTGREVFGRAFVERLAATAQPADLAATLTALTAHTIGGAIRRWVAPLGADEVVVTGGGTHNPVLLQMIEREVAPLPLVAAASLGVDPDAKEAVAFAALAWAHLRGACGNMPEATGAAGPRLLGSWTPGC